MFSKVQCRVKWNLCISDILKSEFGVLQGLFTTLPQDIYKLFDQDQGIYVDT